MGNEEAPANINADALRCVPHGEAMTQDELTAALAALRNEERLAKLAAEQENDRLKQAIAELAENAETIAALELKLKALAPHTCGCSYDKPGDMCMHHSPRLAQATALLEECHERHNLAPDNDPLRTRVRTFLQSKEARLLE